MIKMKVAMEFAIIVVSLLVFSCYAISDDEVLKEWAQFQIQFQKSYKSPVESRERLSIFKDNLLKIEAHNELFKRGEETYDLGISQFADMSEAEFLQYVNKYEYEITNFETVEIEKHQNLTLPSSVDWRSKGAVSGVKNQGQCGSCWSFSATGALEGQAALRRGQRVSLSEQDLIDCATSAYHNMGCNGGNMLGSFQFVTEHGIDSESHYRYEAKQGACRHSRSVFRIRSYASLVRGESNLQAAVSSVGPISVAIEATSNLQHYRSGVIYDRTCTNRLNHGVLVVGYGVQSGQNYWLIKNSWGSAWGESGYFKLARNRGDNCGISSAACFPKV